ncbi:MAG TPA: hypothetical protein DD670_17630 [Planctomycetaceae bacterium]|nr:hypothetical protein [Planctomycetaceae bacterium]
MGIRVQCPNGHKLNIKATQAGKRGICPRCGIKFDIPAADEATDSNGLEETVATAPDNEPADSPPPLVGSNGPSVEIPSITIVPDANRATTRATSRLPHRRSRRRTTNLVVALTVTVLFLGVVLAWILLRSAS